MKDIVDKHCDELLKKKNVIGVAVGQKWSDGKNTGEDAIIVFVEKKESSSKLSKKDQIDKEIDGVKTDVVGKTGGFESLPYTGKERPIAPGISCGHMWVTAGTIGGIFENRENLLIMLSNNHVLAATNRGLKGHIALQPGPYDGGKRVANRVGLLRYFRGLVRGTKRSYDAVNRKRIYGYNLEDSAIAQIDNPDNASELIKDIGAISGWNDNPTVGLSVQKTGRTTGYTTGSVIGLHATINVSYGSQGVFKFKDCIVTGNMAKGGDSGSLLLDMSNNATGLLFAGSSNTTIYNPIKYPRATYGLKIYNTIPVTETFSIVVKENGSTVSHSYVNAAAFPKAVQDALKKAKASNITVDVTASYNVTPE